MELARNAKVDLRAAEPERQCSDTSFAEVYAANEKPSLNIAKAKAELKRWEKRWRETDEFVAWPACATTSKQFVGIWREAFRPLRDWVNACALCVAAEVQRDYREFRLERGLVTYADQVALAGELMRLPDVARRRSEEHTSELQSQSNLVCRLLLEKKKKRTNRRSLPTTCFDNTTSC